MSHVKERARQRSRHAECYWAIAQSGKYNDDPCKIETNARGEVVKEPPPTAGHKWIQNQIQKLLNRALDGGEAATEFPVHAPKGTKLADVAWVSFREWKKAVADEVAVPVPLVCVEVLSPSNTGAEMEEKRQLYLAIGVEEVWICDPDGALRFYDENGQLETSRVVESAPDRISTDVGS